MTAEADAGTITLDADLVEEANRCVTDCASGGDADGDDQRSLECGAAGARNTCA